MLPAKSMEGVEVMSANLLLDKDTDPVIWRGPVIAGAVKQFWSETPYGRMWIICSWICRRAQAMYP